MTLEVPTHRLQLRKRILFENRSHSRYLRRYIQSEKRVDQFHRNCTSEDKQPVDLEPTIDGVDNEHFIFGSKAQVELAEEQEVSKIEHLLKNIKRTILEMADGNKSQIYTPELDGKDPNQYRRLEYQVEGQELFKGQTNLLAKFGQCLDQGSQKKGRIGVCWFGRRGQK